MSLWTSLNTYVPCIKDVRIKYIDYIIVNKVKNMFKKDIRQKHSDYNRHDTELPDPHLITTFRLPQVYHDKKRETFIFIVVINLSPRIHASIHYHNTRSAIRKVETAKAFVYIPSNYVAN